MYSKMSLNLESLCLNLPNAGVIGLCHHSDQLFFFLIFNTSGIFPEVGQWGSSLFQDLLLRLYLHLVLSGEVLRYNRLIFSVMFVKLRPFLARIFLM